MLRHIAWFNEAPIEPNPAGGLRSDDPRVRRRCLEPAAVLEGRGIACSVFGNLHDADPAEVSKLLQKLNTDIVVIGAFSDPSLVKLARAAKHLGCYIVADFADQPHVSEDFKKLAAIADGLVASTSEAAAGLETEGMLVTIIPDVDGDVESVADAWLECFKTLKLKPPACANTNTPPPDHD
jgi:sugar phosphate isomerase/epimerase